MKISPAWMLMVLMLAAGCSGTHLLPKGEKLYTGSEVKLKKDGKIAGKKIVQADVEAVLKPKPNKKLLGIFRPKLWIYEVTGTPKRKNGLRSKLKKLGEAPVLFSKISPVNTSSYIKNRLENNGYFHSIISYEVKEKKHTASVLYTATLSTPYFIDSIIFPQGGSDIETLIRGYSKESLVKGGDLYNLNMLKAERERIDQALKNEGYFYFNPDYLVFHADTGVGNNKIKLTLSIKDEAPEKALMRYRINRIIIEPSFSLRKNSTLHRKLDTLLVDGKYYVEADSSLKPRVVTSSVFFTHNDYYRRTNHDLTLRRLMGIGIFKYINIKFTDEQKGDTAFLNVNISLTQLHKHSLRAELLGISKSTNYAGPGLNVSFRNRNLFKGSELFILEAQSNFESQISKRIPGQPALGSFNINLSGKLYFPRFITPFHVTSNSYFVPKTKIELGGERIYHFQYFTLNNVQALFGYNWNESQIKTHEYNPLFINYVAIQNPSVKFDSLINRNILLKNNFQQQFVVGTNYSFTLNTQLVKQLGSQVYFKGTFETAGNLFSLANLSLGAGKITGDNPKKLFGSPYSQYVRPDIDIRYYYTWNTNQKLATRLIAGIGIPYGNANTLPYIKQFFIGGSNSIRAFRARTLGPGTNPPPSADTLSFFEQAGDVKLEMNAEYRFGIIGIVKGAVFVDAGNIWLVNNDPLRRGGLFTSNFYKELAAGTGAGLRFDASFIIVRFDLTFPIRKPWLPENERWVFKQIDFGSPAWRRDNLVLNIAIGYPF